MSGTAKILIVDDQRELREYLRFILKDRYAVATVGEAEEAFKYLAEYSVDLVLLDLKMPKIDGITALEEIKKINPDTEVIMTTAYAPVDTMRKAFNLGVFAFLMKPFDIDKLINTIDKAIKKENNG